MEPEPISRTRCRVDQARESLVRQAMYYINAGDLIPGELYPRLVEFGIIIEELVPDG